MTPEVVAPSEAIEFRRSWQRSCYVIVQWLKARAFEPETPDLNPGFVTLFL